MVLRAPTTGDDGFAATAFAGDYGSREERPVTVRCRRPPRSVLLVVELDRGLRQPHAPESTAPAAKLPRDEQGVVSNRSHEATKPTRKHTCFTLPWPYTPQKGKI